MKKSIVLILTILGIPTLMATELTSTLGELSSTLLNLENIYRNSKPDKKLVPEPVKKGSNSKKLLDKLTNEYYQNLKEALNKNTDSPKKVVKQLKAIDQWTPTLIAEHITQLLIKRLVDHGKIKIVYKDLPEYEAYISEFNNYILFIAKIVTTIMSLYGTDKPISIFSDELFDKPLLLFLLMSSLEFIGYKTITLNLLTTKKTNYTSVKALLNKPGHTINTFKTAQELINSNIKMDMYLTNLTVPLVETADCLSHNSIIIGEYSKHLNEIFFILDKSVNRTQRTTINKVLNQIIENYITTNELMPKQNSSIKIGTYDCESSVSVNSTLADIIFATQNLSLKEVPLFEFKFSIKDTGTGIEAITNIIEASLSFDDYADLFAALYTIELAFVSNDFSAETMQKQLLSYSIDAKKLGILKKSLANITSKITIFLKGRKLLAPSETVISD